MKKLYSFLLFVFFGILSTYAQTLDESFVKPIPYKAAKTAVIKELSDGKILLGGNIGFYKDKKVNNLIRLNADFSLDETFVFIGDPKFEIKDVKFQSNGNIIVLTTLDNLGVADFFKLYQLDSNGGILKEINTIFNATSIAVQSDDKILVTGGAIGYYDYTSCYLNRYNSDFSLDETFNNNLAFNASTNTVVVSDNGIYVGGQFTEIDGNPKKGIVKLNSDGEIDTTFDVSESIKGIFSLTLQDDGKLLIGGNFLRVIDGQDTYNMCRLNPDGSLDTSFTSQYYSFPYSAVTVKNDSIYISAGINNDVEYNYYLIKLNGDGSLDENFSPSKLNEFTYNFAMCFSGDKILYNSSGNVSNKYDVSVCDALGNPLDSSELKPSRFGSFELGDSFDNKLVVKGDFIKINDVETFGIGLLNENGSVDESFVFSKYLGDIKQFQVVDNNTIFVSTKTKFLKLNNNGDVLKDFNFKTDSQLLEMSKFKVLESGKILVTDQWNLFRLSEEGIQEAQYILNPDTNIWITGLNFELQDNKILCSGIYNVFNNGGYKYKMTRLNLDGSLDESFKINGSGPDESVYNFKILNSGEILCAGGFKTFNGVDVPNEIVKLSKDSIMDLQFNENQKGGKIGYSQNHDFRKLEELDSVIYITEGDANVTAINLDGTFVKDFEMPVEMDKVSDIVALEEPEASTNKSKAKFADNKDKYIFAIGSSKNTGNEPSSFIVKVNIGKSGSLSTNPTPEKLSSNVQFYPVPVSNKLNLSFSDSISPNKIAVYSINGAELYSNKIQGSEAVEVDMSKFKSGTYIIKLFSDSGVVTKKIIKK